MQMPFEAKRQAFNASISTLEVGTGSTTLELGGENVWPLYTFDGPLANPPRIGVEISDLGTGSWNEALKSFYDGCSDAASMAKRASTILGADFLCLAFEGADPDGANKSIDECASTAKAFVEASPLPVAIAGCDNPEVDAKLFTRLAEELQGANVLFLSAKEDNYKAVGTGVALAWGQKIAAESAVDINLAKQLNLLLEQLGVQNSSRAMNVGEASAGYGFEYVVSTMERVKAAALQQNDTALQVPIITPVSKDAWSTKEAVVDEGDYPEWGPSETRGIYMETVTAAACLASGSNAVILRHPEAVSSVATLITLLTEGGE